ncbi:hypothetical protein JCM11491_000826 [Sporobolomyces phaffii]
MPQVTECLTEASLTTADGTELSYALHRPSTPTATPKLAIIAHPWGRLGGSKNDHMVRSLARTLAQEEGYTVVRFDSRGAGDSGGTPSWTAATEVDDFRTVRDSVLLPLLSTHSSPVRDESPVTVKLLLCGYSFGSLLATACPPPAPTAHFSFETRYLVVSYPLSVMFALTAFHSALFTRALQDRVVEEGTSVCTVYGDGDQFSGVGELRRWSAGLDKLASDRGQEGKVAVIEVEGADHFWAHTSTKSEALDRIRRWLHETGG